MITIIVSQNELVHNVESLVKLNFHIPSPRFMHLNVCCSLVTFGNAHKVDTKATMNEKKNDKSTLIMVYNASTFKIKRK